MKFSVNWLREFVSLPTSPEELSELLTLAGIEVEGTERRGANFENVVVAQITASTQHPNADRLSVCEVDDGSGQKRQIVCGAKNYKVGDKVPLALPGAVLTKELKIGVSKLRGIESQGMLCSPVELGLSEEKEGLLILSPDAKIGAPIGSLFPEDTILDVEITPNRGDLLSHFGLAREIAALTGAAAPSPRGMDGANENNPPRGRGGSIQISAPAECPFYSARRIENVTVRPSPEWLRAKIESVGVRSINNIVDITNFVMLELGQPLHAFDAGKIEGGINVRLAKEGERFLALDGKIYSLGKSNLVIADEKRAVAIAGVMGGEDTGVTEATRNVLLESAYFQPASVRRTARKLNLPSDSSYRFERGVDPGMVIAASHRAAGLIREIAGGDPAGKLNAAGEVPPNPPDVKLRYEKCDALLGIKIGPKTGDEILSRFGLQKAGAGDGESSWRIPSFRRDLRREADLIEEIVRIFGIEKIPTNDRSRFTAVSRADVEFDSESKLRQRLVAHGLSEARTSALIPRGENLFVERAIELRNPLSEDHVVLRPALLPGLLRVLARNIRSGATTVRIFEMGRVFNAPDGSEKRHLGFVLHGQAERNPHWRGTARRKLDLFDLKGALEGIGRQQLSFQRSKRRDLAVAAEVTCGAETVGFIGQLMAARANELGATGAVVVGEIAVEPILELFSRVQTFREIDKFPSVTRDIAMIVPEQLSHAEIFSVIKKVPEPLLAAVELFDLFSGEGGTDLGAGKKSLAYTLTYRDKARTLTNDEINVIHARIRERLKEELPVELRE